MSENEPRLYQLLREAQKEAHRLGLGLDFTVYRPGHRPDKWRAGRLAKRREDDARLAEVLRMKADKMKNKDIAVALGIDESTVRRIRKRARDRASSEPA